MQKPNSSRHADTRCRARASTAASSLVSKAPSAAFRAAIAASRAASEAAKRSSYATKRASKAAFFESARRSRLAIAEATEQRMRQQGAVSAPTMRRKNNEVLVVARAGSVPHTGAGVQSRAADAARAARRAAMRRARALRQEGEGEAAAAACHRPAATSCNCAGAAAAAARRCRRARVSIEMQDRHLCEQPSLLARLCPSSGRKEGTRLCPCPSSGPQEGARQPRRYRPPPRLHFLAKDGTKADRSTPCAASLRWRLHYVSCIPLLKARGCAPARAGTAHAFRACCVAHAFQRW